MIRCVCRLEFLARLTGLKVLKKKFLKTKLFYWPAVSPERCSRERNAAKKGYQWTSLMYLRDWACASNLTSGRCNSLNVVTVYCRVLIYIHTLYKSNSHKRRVKKHCQRHNGPRLLSVKLGLFLRLKRILSPTTNMITSFNTPYNSCTTLPTLLVTTTILCISPCKPAAPHIAWICSICLVLYHRLVLSWYHYKPESHQQSFQKVF